MKEFKKVKSSAETIEPLLVGKDKVYARENIKHIIANETQNFEGWEYDEIQYDKDEYLQKLNDTQSFILAKMVGAELNLQPEQEFELMNIALKSAPLVVIQDNMEWKPWIKAKKGTHVTYNEIGYEAIQTHVTQPGWEPDKTLSLWLITKQDFAEWKQPQGGHDAYKLGDKVLYKTKKYESLINANVHSPEAYPQGWKLL